VDVKRVLHLVRADAAPAAVADRDWVVYLQPARLVRGGAPHTAPLPLGPLSHDQIVDLVFAADLVVTW
jgi:hypothetical protein